MNAYKTNYMRRTQLIIIFLKEDMTRSHVRDVESVTQDSFIFMKGEVKPFVIYVKKKVQLKKKIYIYMKIFFFFFFFYVKM